MNKTGLIHLLSQETLLSKRDVSRVLDAFSRAVVRSLKKGEKVQWSGFGTFQLAYRAARNGVNPTTKQKILLPEMYVPRFKAGKILKGLVRR
jgi:DNA-binding protein HU-beta